MKGKYAINIKKAALTMQGHDCLKIPSFQVRNGETVLIHGENGSGKTLLLKMLAGLMVPDSGQVRVFNTPLNELKKGHRDTFRAKHMGIVFQQLHLLPYLPALQNIILPLGFSECRKEHVKHSHTTPEFEAYQLMARLKLEDPKRLQIAAEQLSIGLQQRIAVARALMGAPNLILADEPASSLDTAGKQIVFRFLVEYCREHNSTLVCISHDHGAIDGEKSQCFDRTIDMADINSVSQVNPLW
ncbi:Lipoprotein-releasing system ATP-binding protein LolD [invertebrate metagenome]|uniref:Lipoprotein-releasing system ATP-binding protein LolD n=1 Tax=invertebrate metagenome TaxID=1711999 RepID=A0A2H9T9J7_9ZZZZ